jgi:glycosyltransferase involved in cell wall biosynthesis
MKLENTRLLIVVDNADYRQHLASAGLTQMLFDQPAEHLSEENWHIFNAAVAWRSQLQEVAIFSAYSQEAYSTATDIGLQLIGSGIPDPEHIPISPRKQIQLVADFCPTHIVMCTPSVSILNWANRNRIPSVVLLCDWQEPLNWLQRWQHARLIRQLNCESVHWVGSHGVYGCKILAGNGINPRKIIPWEWPQPDLPERYQPKQLRYDLDVVELVYVGTLRMSAGVGDLLLALNHIRQKGTAVHLNIIHKTTDKSRRSAHHKTPLSQPLRDEILGEAVLRKLLAGESIATGIDEADLPDDSAPSIRPFSLPAELAQEGIDELARNLDRDLETLRSQIQQLNLTECISLIPDPAETELLEYVRKADVAVIPGDDRARLSATSASSPRTTHYSDRTKGTASLDLAMAARTPIIASDHPHLSEHLVHGVNAMIFPAGNAKSMAHRIERVLSQPQLYAQISEALGVSLSTMKVPARWSELIDYWLNSKTHTPESKNNQQQLCNWAFSSGRYRGIPSLQHQTPVLGSPYSQPFHPQPTQK